MSFATGVEKFSGAVADGSVIEPLKLYLALLNYSSSIFSFSLSQLPRVSVIRSMQSFKIRYQDVLILSTKFLTEIYGYVTPAAWISKILM